MSLPTLPNTSGTNRIAQNTPNDLNDQTDHSQTVSHSGTSSHLTGQGHRHSKWQKVEYTFFDRNKICPTVQKPQSDEFIRYVVQKIMTRAYTYLDLEKDASKVADIEIEMFTNEYFLLSLHEIMLEDDGFDIVIPNAPGYGPLTVGVLFYGDRAPRTFRADIFKGRSQAMADLLYHNTFDDDEVHRARLRGRYDHSQTISHSGTSSHLTGQGYRHSKWQKVEYTFFNRNKIHPTVQIVNGTGTPGIAGFRVG